MTNEQLYLAIDVPLLFNATLIGILVAWVNSKFDAVNSKFDAKFDSIDTRFDAVNARFDAIDKRFDDMRGLWRSELRRVEEVIDARLKQVEERH